uniref:Uncharacterized protein n=1 Tax=Nothobranchius furzeri TaxID=105023 RepID=A0A8C6M9N8_NOTFU
MCTSHSDLCAFVANLCHLQTRNKTLSMVFCFIIFIVNIRSSSRWFYDFKFPGTKHKCYCTKCTSIMISCINPAVSFLSYFLLCWVVVQLVLDVNLLL